MSPPTFVIASLPRTGSTLVSDVLAASGAIYVYGEHLLPSAPQATADAVCDALAIPRVPVTLADRPPPPLDPWVERYRAGS